MKQLTSFTTGGLSPCVWGHQKGRGIYIRISGSIPMCMGPPPQKNTVMIKKWVYPHVYGPPFFHSLFKKAVWVYPQLYWATHMPATPSLTKSGSSPSGMGPLAKSRERPRHEGANP